MSKYKFNIIKSCKLCTLINNRHIISIKKISKITDKDGNDIPFDSFNKSSVQGLFFYSLKKQFKNDLLVFGETSDIFPFYSLDASDFLVLESSSYSKEKIDFFSTLTKDLFYEILTLKYNYSKSYDDRFANLLKKLPPTIISKKSDTEVDVLNFRDYVSGILSVIQYRSDSAFINKVLSRNYILDETKKISFFPNMEPSEEMRIKCVSYLKVFKDFIEEEMKAMKEFNLSCIKE